MLNKLKLIIKYATKSITAHWFNLVTRPLNISKNNNKIYSNTLIHTHFSRFWFSVIKGDSHGNWLIYFGNHYSISHGFGHLFIVPITSHRQYRCLSYRPCHRLYQSLVAHFGHTNRFTLHRFARRSYSSVTDYQTCLQDFGRGNAEHERYRARSTRCGYQLVGKRAVYGCA